MKRKYEMKSPLKQDKNRSTIPQTNKNHEKSEQNTRTKKSEKSGK